MKFCGKIKHDMDALWCKFGMNLIYMLSFLILPILGYVFYFKVTCSMFMDKHMIIIITFLSLFQYNIVHKIFPKLKEKGHVNLKKVCIVLSSSLWLKMLFRGKMFNKPCFLYSIRRTKLLEIIEGIQQKLIKNFHDFHQWSMQKTQNQR